MFGFEIMLLAYCRYQVVSLFSPRRPEHEVRCGDGGKSAVVQELKLARLYKKALGTVVNNRYVHLTRYSELMGNQQMRARAG